MIAELQSALHDPTLSKAEFVRVQAVLLRKRKQKRTIIAELTGKSVSVVEDWITAYHQRGLSGLRTKKRSTPARSQLTNHQRKQLCILLQKKPSETGIAQEEYWRMGLVKQLVERETGVVFRSENSYRSLLDEAGLSYQKVEQVDTHQDTGKHAGFKKQFEAKVKGGRISMWW